MGRTWLAGRDPDFYRQKQQVPVQTQRAGVQQMILSHKHKFIFIKTYKTASTSIEIALSQFLGERDVITTIDPQDEGTRAELGFRGPQNYEISLARYTLRNWGERLLHGKRAVYYNHMPAREIRAYARPRVWRTYYRFCFERNPWDKAVSLYYWKTQHMRPRPSMLSFLRSADSSELSSRNLYTIGGRLAVDCVGRYETLEADLRDISLTLGLPADLQLPLTKSDTRKDRRPYQAIMSCAAQELVAQVCAGEISLFGYTFE